jgi:cytochrome c-type biogenesis protein CcmH
MRRLMLAVATSLALAGAAHAVLPSEQLADPRLEARARRIGDELRCLVCQNETIEDSDAPIAGDLRVLLRQRLQAGDSDRQAIDFIVARYGHFVLLKPPLEPTTVLLWFGPLLVLVAGGAGLAAMARRGARGLDVVPPLTPDEEALLARRLEGEI